MMENDKLNGDLLIYENDSDVKVEVILQSQLPIT